MSTPKPTLTQEEGAWVIRVDNGAGKIQTYHCASEAQAKQLMAVLTPKEKPGAR